MSEEINFFFFSFLPHDASGHPLLLWRVVSVQELPKHPLAVCPMYSAHPLWPPLSRGSVVQVVHVDLRVKSSNQPRNKQMIWSLNENLYSKTRS